MIYDEDGECWTAEHDDDLFGWKIIDDVLWKVGVRRLMVSREHASRTVYVSDPLAELKGTERAVCGTMDAAQTAVQNMIATQLMREFTRIRRAYLRRHTISLTDSMGSVFISVYDGLWNSGCCVTGRLQVLEARAAEIPSWLLELDRLESWYCKMADLAKVSVELKLPPLPPPPVVLRVTPLIEFEDD